MNGWIAGIVVFSLLGGRAVYCAAGNPGFQACMQSGMPKMIGMALATAVLLFAIWIGPKIGQRLRSEVLGYFSGVAIFLALATALLSLGILQP
jgi:hypothetical protein